ncbi:MAG: metal ABC transporter permease [Anaerolineales bacterium]|nr:metal ABC transporter permease [Anaerolineales bacterium]
MIDFLLTPLEFEFMQRAFVAVGLVCVLCSVVGCFVILRSMAFLGDAIAHSILPGVAVAYLVGANLTLGALVAAGAVAAGIAFLSRKGALQEDTAIGILFSSALALGIALISTIRSYATDLSHILFGNLLGVRPEDLLGIAVIGAGILLLLFLAYRPLLIVTFDPILAATLRLPIDLLRTAFLIIIALTIVVSLQVTGVALVTAMLVTPAATAYLVTRRFPEMVLFSALFGLLAGITGLYASYYLNIASGASVVLSATGLFLLAFLFAPRKGWITTRIRQGRSG